MVTGQVVSSVVPVPETPLEVEPPATPVLSGPSTATPTPTPVSTSVPQLTPRTVFPVVSRLPERVKPVRDSFPRPVEGLPQPSEDDPGVLQVPPQTPALAPTSGSSPTPRSPTPTVNPVTATPTVTSPTPTTSVPVRSVDLADVPASPTTECEEPGTRRGKDPSRPPGPGTEARRPRAERHPTT